MTISCARRLGLLAVFGALVAVASVVPVASAAAARYAGVDGVGTACTSAPKAGFAGIKLLTSELTLSIASGRQAKLRVRVSRSGQRVIRRAGRLRGRASIAARGGTGEAKTTVSPVTIRVRRP